MRPREESSRNTSASGLVALEFGRSYDPRPSPPTCQVVRGLPCLFHHGFAHEHPPVCCRGLWRGGDRVPEPQTIALSEGRGPGMGVIRSPLGETGSRREPLRGRSGHGSHPKPDPEGTGNRRANPWGSEVGGRLRESYRQPINRQSQIRHCSIIGNYCQYQRNHRTAKTIIDHFS